MKTNANKYRLTVGALKAFLEGIPDDEVVYVHSPGTPFINTLTLHRFTGGVAITPWTKEAFDELVLKRKA